MTYFSEQYRPQFHYSAIKGWINDPIGLVHYDGEYHIFNDHNPVSCGFPGGTTDGEQSHWSHAISTDLVHWKHMPAALYPDKNGACWSGSGNVDWKNTTGFQHGKEPPLVLCYTSAGKSFGQSLAYSNDRGRTWQEYPGNPVLGQLAEHNRDPMVFRHERSGKWVMVLYVERGYAHFFTSGDMKTWTPTSVVELDGFHECPDMFELPIENGDERKWVLYDARFMYWIGQFDGHSFIAEEGPIRGDHGKNFYAAQSWHNVEDRRIQIAWMNGGEYPDMPFNQQMGFPCRLTLQRTSKGIRLFRYPVHEIESLYADSLDLTGITLEPETDPLPRLAGDLFDIELDMVPEPAAVFRLQLHGMAVTYAEGTLTSLDCSVPVELCDGHLRLRVLLDRTSVEVFAQHGRISMSSCTVPGEADAELRLCARNGNVRISAARISKLKSCWL